MGQIIRSLASVCLCVCVCLSSLLRLQFWIEFDEILHGRLVPENDVRVRYRTYGQNPIISSPILPPVFTTPSAFSMGRSKHCSIDARCLIAVVNTSHDASRQPLVCVTKNKLEYPNVPNRIPKICAQCIYNRNILSNIWRIITNDARYGYNGPHSPRLRVFTWPVTSPECPDYDS